nr:alpha/beta fold hydrolase [Paraburkholderia xenovorans]
MAGRHIVCGDCRAPLDAFDDFSKQFVSRWASNDAWTQAAYHALVQRVCPCIVIAHSQGANFAFTAALHAPDKIKAIVAFEPTGARDDMRDPTALKGIPQIFVWGDDLDSSPRWRRRGSTRNSPRGLSPLFTIRPCRTSADFTFR